MSSRLAYLVLSVLLTPSAATQDLDSLLSGVPETPASVDADSQYPAEIIPQAEEEPTVELAIELMHEVSDEPLPRPSEPP